MRIVVTGGRGTADMVARCTKAGLPVWKVPAKTPATPPASHKPPQS